MASNGKLANWVLGIAGPLTVLGVASLIYQSGHANTKLAIISIQMTSVQEDLDLLRASDEAQSKKLKETEVGMAALEMLLNGVNSNHMAIRAELAAVRARQEKE